MVQIGLCIGLLFRVFKNNGLPSLAYHLLRMNLHQGRIELGIFCVSRDFADISSLSHCFCVAVRSSDAVDVSVVVAATAAPAAGAGAVTGVVSANRHLDVLSKVKWPQKPLAPTVSWKRTAKIA